MDSILRRLKDRKIVQWAITYVAAAWVVVEATGTALETWEVPILLVRGIHVILGLGFFFTLVIAWYHGEKGRQRVSGPEILVIALLLAIAGGLLAVLRGRTGEAEPEERAAVDTSRPAIAVLPCANISPNPEDTYLAEGIHEEILLSLQRIPTLLSIGRTSVLGYADSPPPVKEIGATLRVGFVGECTVRKDMDRMRLTFQLLDAETGAQLWADRYDRSIGSGSLWDVQSEIAQKIAHAMTVYLGPEDDLLVRARPTEKDQAYDLYLRGRSAERAPGLESLLTAVGHYENALDIDPAFAHAYAGVANAYIVSAHRGLPAREAFEQVERAASRAIALDSTLAEPHAALADSRYHYHWDWAGAEEGFDRAFRLDPDLPTGHTWYAGMLAALGRFDEALVELDRAERADPLSLNVFGMQNLMLYYAGRYEEVVRRSREMLQRGPEFGWLVRWIAIGKLQQGSPEEALPLLEAATDRPEDPDHQSDRVRVLAAAGRTDEARRTLTELIDMAVTVHVPSYLIALGQAALGERDSAFQWLDRAYEERNAALIWVNVEPGFDSLRDDPRFGSLLARMNLPPTAR